MPLIWNLIALGGLLLASVDGYPMAPSSIRRVVGGAEAPVGKYNFTAGMRSSPSGSSFCGGTLVTPRHIITAAHCADLPISYVSVGTHFLKGATDGEQIEVAKVTVHPDYNGDDLSNDIAVVELAEDSTMPTAALADMPNKASLVGEKVTVVGWGRTNYPGPQSPVLKELDVEVVSQTECQEKLARWGNISDAMICAGGIAGEASCKGDSGGPLVRYSEKQTVLVGAVSWGIPCGQGNPDVYARIANLRSFIDEHVEGAEWVEL